jgi:predicted nucleotidyltransferase
LACPRTVVIGGQEVFSRTTSGDSEKCTHFESTCALVLRSVMHLTDEQLTIIITWVKKTPEVQAVFLYGSRAKGTGNPDSDVVLALSIKALRQHGGSRNSSATVVPGEQSLRRLLVFQCSLSGHAVTPTLKQVTSSCGGEREQSQTGRVS